MCWIHRHVIAERQDPVVERSKELMRKTGCVLVAEQIRAGDCAREQAAAAE